VKASRNERRPLFLTRPQAALLSELVRMLDDPDVPARKRKTAQEIWAKLPHAWIDGREEEVRAEVFGAAAKPAPKKRRPTSPEPPEPETGAR
jgi:hypothetical protein